MEIKGAYKIAATREQVWAALNDPEILKKCLPGCDVCHRALGLGRQLREPLLDDPLPEGRGGQVRVGRALEGGGPGRRRAGVGHLGELRRLSRAAAGKQGDREEGRALQAHHVERPLHDRMGK